MPLTTKSESTEETRLGKDLLPADHRHIWEFVYDTRYSLCFPGRRCCRLMGLRWRTGALAMAYENLPDFRSLIA